MSTPSKKHKHKRGRKIVINPFMLQHLFTSQRNETIHKHINFIRAIIDTMESKRIVPKKELRDVIVSEAATKAGLSGYDKSKLVNDLIRLGIVIGGERKGSEEESFAPAKIGLAFHAPYYVVSTSVASLPGAEDEALVVIGETYVKTNPIVGKILRGYMDIMEEKREEKLEVARKDITSIKDLLLEPASKAIAEIARSFVESNSKELEILAHNLTLLAEEILSETRFIKTFVSKFLVPLAVLSRNRAVQVTRSKIEVYRSGLGEFLGEKTLDLDTIVRAYCETASAFGFRLKETAARWGPELPIYTIAKRHNMPFKELLKYIINYSQASPDIEYQIEPGLNLNDPHRHLVRIAMNLVRRIC